MEAPLSWKFCRATGTEMISRVLRGVVVVMLILWSTTSVYMTLFALWMTAYPFANTSEWKTRFYVRLAITAATGLCWGVVALYFFGRRPSGKSGNILDGRRL